MLRKLLMLRSHQLMCSEAFASQQLPALVMRGNGMPFTSLWGFSSQAPSDGNDPPATATHPATPTPSDEAAAAPAPSPSTSSFDAPIDPEALSPTMRKVHDNAGVWRKWLEDKIDEKLQDGRPAPQKRSQPTAYTGGRAPQTRPLRDVVSTFNAEHQQQQSGKPQQPPRPHSGPPPNPRGNFNAPPHPRGPPQGTSGPDGPQKWRPKEPAKDWKHTARSTRSAEDRITSIIVPDSEAGGNTTGKGRYGWLGGAVDAPRISPAVSARAEEASPQRLHPHRLFFPGQQYSPDDLDPYKAQPNAERSGRMFGAKTTVPPRAVDVFADFRNGAFLSQFVSGAGKLLPRRNTKLSAKAHSRMISEVKLARAMGLMHPTQRVYDIQRRQRRHQGEQEPQMGVPRQQGQSQSGGVGMQQ